MINESARVLEEVAGRLKDAAGKLQEYIVRRRHSSSLCSYTVFLYLFFDNPLA